MPLRVWRAVRSSWWLLALSTLAVVALPEVYRDVAIGRHPELSVIGAGALPSMSPARVLDRSFHSDALGRDMPYLVFLPPGYGSTGERYPVLYMLHGIGGDYATEWPGYGLLDSAAAMMARGDVRPFIIVLPEGEDGYWVDHVGGPAWGTYVARDLVAEVDRDFLTVAQANARAVGGNSMGGHGALQLAMNFPGVFGFAGAHSPTLRAFESAPPYFGDAAQFEARDPASIVDARPQAAKALRIAIDVGRDDPWLPGVQSLHEHLIAQDVPHAFDVLPGDHSDAYWRGNVERYLAMYASALRL